MTVRELIEHLQTLPQDVLVVYRSCSDYEVMDVDDIRIQRSTDPLKYGSAIAHHNMPRRMRAYDGRYEYKDQPLPKPLDVVIFSGN